MTKWTSAQEDAINARNGTVLVSAAAGSGKTAVLSERVMKRLTDKDNPTYADRLLIVTFTNAAAAEMKQRIHKKFQALIDENPFDGFLREQQLRLQRMQISTVHSFCAQLVKENFYRLNISPTFTLLDEKSPQMLLVSTKILSEILENRYSNLTDEFLSLANTFGSAKSDKGVEDVILETYRFTRSLPFPEIWMNKVISDLDYSNGIENTPWGIITKKRASNLVQQAERIAKTARIIGTEEGEAELQPCLTDVLGADIASLEAIVQVCEKGTWNEIISSLNLFKAKILRLPKGFKDDPVAVRVKNLREQYKDSVKAAIKLMFDDDQCREDIDNQRVIVEELFSLVSEFSERLAEEKAQRNLADFNDLEHWAIDLLYTKTESGYEKSKLAEEISERYDEIIVDEYQDSNSVQDMIFNAVSKDETNFFFVGDVKQSIYGFRQSEPEMFLRRRELYDQYNREDDCYPSRIILDRNFRSRKEVTESVNYIFRQIMSIECGDIDYNDEEALVAGAAYDIQDNMETEVHIIDKAKGAVEDSDDILEARLIGQKIRSMIKEGFTVTENGASRPATYGDFTILLRSANAHMSNYATELQKMGIPAYANRNPGFLQTKEISFIVSLLRVINNPVQDIPLAAVLMSEVYGFTPDDMAQIHASNPKMNLYNQLRALENERDDIKSFFEDLDNYRALASTLSTNRLLNYIYEKSGYIAVVQSMANGKKRVANLRRLTEFAANTEGSGFNGIASFVALIDNMQSRGVDIDSAVVQNNENAVQIMSIHGSKGLEFPVCILAGAGRQFSRDRAKVFLHRELGLGFKLKPDDFYGRRTTFIREAIISQKNIEDRSEELRVLYVALTRAKEKLIIVSTEKEMYSKLDSISSKVDNKSKINPFTVSQAGSVADWLMMCLLKHPDGKILREKLTVKLYPKSSDCSFKIERHTPIPDENICTSEECRVQPDTKLLSELKERVDFEYPYSNLLDVPAKVTASRLAEQDNEIKNRTLSRPSFMGKKGLTPAERGTATHEFLQYCDYKNIDNIDAEIERLVSSGFITEAEGEAIDRKMLDKFFGSQIFQRIKNSDQIYREYRFTIEIPAYEIDDKYEGIEEKVVLQGAVDLAFIEDGKIVIVDYKTDRTKVASELWNRYKKQISMYEKAMEQTTGRKVKEVMLYSLYMGREVRKV